MSICASPSTSLHSATGPTHRRVARCSAASRQSASMRSPVRRSTNCRRRLIGASGNVEWAKVRDIGHALRSVTSCELADAHVPERLFPPCAPTLCRTCTARCDPRSEVEAVGRATPPRGVNVERAWGRTPKTLGCTLVHGRALAPVLHPTGTVLFISLTSVRTSTVASATNMRCGLRKRRTPPHDALVLGHLRQEAHAALQAR